MAHEWSELTYMEKDANKVDSLRDLLGNPFMAFVGAVVLVFLVLSALYESWSLPLSVILVVPMCLLCALAGVFIAGMDLNIFVQVGFVVLWGSPARTPSSLSNLRATGSRRVRPCTTPPWRPAGCGCGQSS